MKYYKLKLNNTTLMITSSKYLAESHCKRLNEVSRNEYTIETVDGKIDYLEQF